MLRGKKQQLLQLSQEKMTVKGIKTHKGVQVSMKELQNLVPVPSQKVVPSLHRWWAKLLIWHALKQRSLLGTLREDAWGVLGVCVHIWLCTNTCLCCPCAWYSLVRAWDTSLSGCLWQICIDPINNCDWGLQFKQAMRSRHKSVCHVATSFTINLP